MTATFSRSRRRIPVDTFAWAGDGRLAACLRETDGDWLVGFDSLPALKVRKQSRGAARIDAAAGQRRNDLAGRTVRFQELASQIDVGLQNVVGHVATVLSIQIAQNRRKERGKTVLRRAYAKRRIAAALKVRLPTDSGFKT